MTAEDRRLTELLQDAADGIEPADRLTAIRDRVDAAAEARRRRAWWMAGGGTLVAAAAVTAVALTGGLTAVDRATTPDPAAPGPATSSPPAAAPSPTTSAGPGTVAVPVYFAGDTPLGPRLSREFQATAADDPVTDAARRATAGTPLDPDYRSAWGGADVVASVTYDAPADEFVVRFRASLASADLAIDPAESELALQSLVYTVQGAAGRTAPLTFWLGDERVDSVLGVDTSQPLGRAPGLDVLSLVNVTTPEQGAVVTGPEMPISGVASSFEATVPWEVLDVDGEPVLSGFAMAEGWDRVLPWEGSVDVSGLPPGDYTFVARTDDPSAGEGPGPFEDTKDFTIE